MATANESPYFDDGDIAVELGVAGYGTPDMSRETVRVELPDRPAEAHGLSGGVQNIQLTCGRKRANLGDAERYAFEKLKTLATSGYGVLGVRDWQTGRTMYSHKWENAICVDASATIEAFSDSESWVAFDYRFLAPSAPPPTTTTAATTTTTWPPQWPAPDPPSTYAGTSTSQDYTAGGVDLGVGGTMDVEMVRNAELRTVPRARGARPGGPESGAAIHLTVNSHIRADDTHIAQAIEDKVRAIPDGKIDLVANGVTYQDVLLRSINPEHGQQRTAAFTAEFVKEL